MSTTSSSSHSHSHTTPSQSQHSKRSAPKILTTQKQLDTHSLSVRPVDKSTVFNTQQFKRVIHDEYLTRYLTALGVTPSTSLLELTKQHIPYQQLKIQPAFKNDVIHISREETNKNGVKEIVSNQVKVHNLITDMLTKQENVFEEIRVEQDKKKKLSEEEPTFNHNVKHYRSALKHLQQSIETTTPFDTTLHSSTSNSSLNNSSSSSTTSHLKLFCLHHFLRAHSFRTVTRKQQLSAHNSSTQPHELSHYTLQNTHQELNWEQQLKDMLYGKQYIGKRKGQMWHISYWRPQHSASQDSTLLSPTSQSTSTESNNESIKIRIR